MLIKWLIFEDYYVETLVRDSSALQLQYRLISFSWKCAPDFFAAPRAPARGATFLRPAPPAPLPTLRTAAPVWRGNRIVVTFLWTSTIDLVQDH